MFDFMPTVLVALDTYVFQGSTITLEGMGAQTLMSRCTFPLYTDAIKTPFEPYIQS